MKLIQKPVRSQSGVSVVAVMTAPRKCRHGTCTFCPGGPGSVFGDVPQSYTGREPNPRRAARNLYDPYMQVFNRLEQYIVTGHLPEKVELIIMGGTFPSYPLEYQHEFVAYLFKALNDFSSLFMRQGRIDMQAFKGFFELPGDIQDESRARRLHEKMLSLKGKYSGSMLAHEQLRNEKAASRCIALCIETKPDWCMQPHISQILQQGATRVELGIQTIYDEILKLTNRGHTNQDSILATRLLKDSFMKVGYHAMPGLPDVSREMDMKALQEYIDNPDYRPDAFKLYPCMVLKGTTLYNQWKQGKFTPITTAEAASIITDFKKIVPEYVRIMRVQRDIPTNMTDAGVDKTNLRQYVGQLAREKGVACRCIRCREPKGRSIAIDNVKIKAASYEASKGTEIFIAAEDLQQDILVGFCRLRIPYMPFRPEITQGTAGIRELHVYGKAVPLGKKDSTALQHQGFGSQLLAEAEKIAREQYDARKMLVISGVGAKEYYRKFGYKTDGVYVSKTLD
ncbi:tRNA uridine(34) 5-carboxymethylaminomethyl modification radical SAM/GNAT enzyme Elp3 [Candidatus Woesearchaeota archaeon]|nr:tRNA uridine(34) 5-carboxymethylaminomethyl modification radical SAM/GNAT enzyme Elp3 [Candidatus Woesearchaeota archaeon]